MATTFQLIDTIKVDTRKNGDISYIDAHILIDGTPRVVNFRAKVGEPPIVVDGDTITVSDELAAAKVDAARVRIAEVATYEAGIAAQIARFGSLAPIDAKSDAQRDYAERSRQAKLPLIAKRLDDDATRTGEDAETLARRFVYIAAQTDPDFWINANISPVMGDSLRRYEKIWYHFA